LGTWQVGGFGTGGGGGNKKAKKTLFRVFFAIAID